jgi:hypothetical protein
MMNSPDVPGLAVALAAIACTFERSLHVGAFDRWAHRIGMEDWPILLQLERAGKLSFRDDHIRQRFQLIKPSSDDPS